MNNSEFKTQSATDYHCHLLPGIDDGPSTMDESVELARAFHGAGYTTVFCTPHLVKGSFDTDNATVGTVRAALQAELTRRQIDLRLLPGREYYLDEFFMEYLQDPQPLGNSRFLLIEVPDYAPAEFVKEACYRIKCSGHVPMIAHPERCVLFALPKQKRESVLDKALGSIFTRGEKNNFKTRALNAGGATNELLDYLRDIGCAFQGNLGSFFGMYGERVRKAADGLQEIQLYTHFGTDVHALENLRHLLHIRTRDHQNLNALY